jgi:hypothetical protein
MPGGSLLQLLGVPEVYGWVAPLSTSAQQSPIQHGKQTQEARNYDRNLVSWRVVATATFKPL